MIFCIHHCRAPHTIGIQCSTVRSLSTLLKYIKSVLNMFVSKNPNHPKPIKLQQLSVSHVDGLSTVYPMVLNFSGFRKVHTQTMSGVRVNNNKGWGLFQRTHKKSPLLIPLCNTPLPHPPPLPSIHPSILILCLPALVFLP